MIICQSGRFIVAGGGGGPMSYLAGTGVVTNYNATVNTPTNPTHASGDTLLCIAMLREAGSLAVSGAGWTDADGITNPITFNGGRLAFYQNECDSASEANPTITPSGSAIGNTLWTVVIRISGRDFAKNFELGTVSNNAISNTRINLANDSPNILDGDGIFAIGSFANDQPTPNTTVGTAAGVTFSNLTSVVTNIGNDLSVGINSGINSSGSTYNAGTAGYIGGFSHTVALVSSGVYLRIPA